MARRLHQTENANMIFFFGRNSVFSNHYQGANFRLDDVNYCNSEQYYLAEKALFTGSKKIRKQILKMTDPADMKQLSKKIPHNSLWYQGLSERVMLNGLKAKFEQNENLATILKLTGDKELVEASPYDCFWGVGLSIDSDEIHDKQKWRGKNMMGKLLMRVRSDLLHRI